MLKVGIIGCGKIADFHILQINRIGLGDIICTCDSEIMMAQQLAERFNIKNYVTDAKQMLEDYDIDVVHITSPPASHYSLAQLCLESGCHVYVEKPFTMNTQEAEELINIASEKNLKLTVGHNAQFNKAARKMRDLIIDGFLGGPPVHMESLFCYGLGGIKQAKELLGHGAHWIRNMPGNLTQNIISHGIAKIAEFLNDENPEVHAIGHTSPFLRNLGILDIIDELRVIIRDGDSATAYFTFSTQICPKKHLFHIYGTNNSILVDHNHQTVIKLENKAYKSLLNQFIPPYKLGKQYKANARDNMHSFFRGHLYEPLDHGMQFLIHQFYNSIINDGQVPISYREILLTSKIMDKIFFQLNKKRDLQSHINSQIHT